MQDALAISSCMVRKQDPSADLTEAGSRLLSASAQGLLNADLPVSTVYKTVGQADGHISCCLSGSFSPKVLQSTFSLCAPSLRLPFQHLTYSGQLRLQLVTLVLLAAPLMPACRAAAALIHCHV